MWGITGRGARLGDGRRTWRSLDSGLARIAVRGPVEHAVLDVSGEVDFSNAQQLRAWVADLDHHIVAIDLSGLEFVDGAGARVLDEVRQDRAMLHGERPAVTGASRTVARTLRYVRSQSPQLQLS